MRLHQDIDKRSLELSRAIIEKIDADPGKKGIEKAKSVCERWYNMNPAPGTCEWRKILNTKEWAEVRQILLDPSENGKQLRQNSPFCGILTPAERWEIYRKFRAHDKATA